jgi:hypothetical protein
MGQYCNFLLTHRRKLLIVSLGRKLLRASRPLVMLQRLKLQHLRQLNPKSPTPRQMAVVFIKCQTDRGLLPLPATQPQILQKLTVLWAALRPLSYSEPALVSRY